MAKFSLKHISAQILEHSHDAIVDLAEHWDLTLAEAIEKLIAAGIARYVGGSEADHIARFVVERFEGEGHHIEQAKLDLDGDESEG